MIIHNLNAEEIVPFNSEADAKLVIDPNTLHTNGRFSHEKASRELDYHPRPIEESIRDSL